MRSRTGILCCVLIMVLSACAGCRDDGPNSKSGNSGHSTTDSHGIDSRGASRPGVHDVTPSAPFHFVSKRATSGIDFVHDSGDSDIKPFPAANGSGVGVVDIDRDGRSDLYFATGNTISDDKTASTSQNKLYRNQGDWKFANRTAESGLGHRGFSAGVAVGDYNDDGFPDVYVTCYGPNRLYENLGDGTFRDVSESSNVADGRWGTSAVFVDYDVDGFLDLYSGHYGLWSPEENQYCGEREKKLRTFCSPTTVQPVGDALYSNQQDGTFNDVTAAVGMGDTVSRTQGVLAADLNGDSYTDLYLGNDLNPNSLFLNEAGKTFSDQAEAIGSGYDRSGVAQAGMGVTTADIDRDGLFDLFVTNFENEHNAFYRQDSAGFYQDTSHLQGLAAAGLSMIGWGTAFADLDLDGWHDAVVINGHTDNNLHELGREGDYEQRPLLWRNVQGQFEQIVNDTGEYFDNVHPGRGLAVADIDNDVDWDLICCHQDTTPELLENDSEATPEAQRFVRLQLIGTRCNRDGIGTVVSVQREGVTIVEQVVAGGSYLSSSQQAIVIRLNAAESATRLRIVWPGGRITETEILRGGLRYVCTEPGDSQTVVRSFQIPD